MRDIFKDQICKKHLSAQMDIFLRWENILVSIKSNFEILCLSFYKKLHAVVYDFFF